MRAAVEADFHLAGQAAMLHVVIMTRRYWRTRGMDAAQGQSLRVIGAGPFVFTSKLTEAVETIGLPALTPGPRPLRLGPAPQPLGSGGSPRPPRRRP
jgi:hypothetical protein